MRWLLLFVYPGDYPWWLTSDSFYLSRVSMYWAIVCRACFNSSFSLLVSFRDGVSL